MDSQLRFRIESIRWESVREIEDATLKLGPSRNFVQIRNGYGKTTTLYLLRSMFAGLTPDAEHFPVYKRSYGGDSDRSRFVVDLLIADRAGVMQPWEVAMEFDHLDRVARFETTSPVIGGRERGWQLPMQFAAKFRNRPHFVELFVFDGETAKELCRRQGSQQIETAIQEMTGLRNVFDHVKESGGHIQAVCEAALESAAINDLEHTHRYWYSARSKLMRHQEAVQQELERDREDLQRLEVELETLKRELSGIQAGEEIAEEIAQYEKQLSELRGDLRTRTRDLLTAVLDPRHLPGRVWADVCEYHAGLLASRIPEGVGRAFFRDLQDEETCVCGTRWTHAMLAHVREQSERYLGDEVLVVVKAMQTRVAEAPRDRGDVLRSHCDQVNSVRTEIAELEESVRVLESSIDSNAAERIESVRARLRGLEDERERVQARIDEVVCDDPVEIRDNGWDRDGVSDSGEVLIQERRFGKCRNLHTLRKIERSLTDRLVQSSPLVHLSAGAECARNVIRAALDDVMSDLRQRLERDTNRRLESMPGTGGGIRVKFGSAGLVFIDGQGREQGGANMGAVLSAAYAFVAAVAALGSVDVPMVVDSPVTGMDYATAEAWATSVVPQFGQMVAFITPGERGLIEHRPDGRDVMYASDAIRVTLCRAAEDPSGSPQTGRMIVKYDEDWYSGYQARDRG